MKTYKVNFNTNEVVVDKNKSASMFKYRALEKDYHKTTDKNKSEFVFNARDFIDALERSKDWYYKEFNETPKSVEVKEIKSTSLQKAA